MTRLASAVRVAALRRLAEAEGGFGMVLKAGESQAGPILVVLLERGGDPRILDRQMDEGGRYRWAWTGPAAADNREEIERFLEKRIRIDPDCWLVELDVARAERFVAEMNAVD